MSLLSTSVTNMSTALTGWFGSANALLVDFKNHIDNHPSNIAPVLINVPGDYSTVEAALNSLAGKQQNSTITEINVSDSYTISTQEKWYSHGLTNIVVTTDSGAPKTITVNTGGTGINFKNGGITLENLHIESTVASTLLYFARIDASVILSNLTFVNAGYTLRSDISKVEMSDCTNESAGVFLQDSDFVARRCSMKGNNAASNTGVWADGSTYARVENTTLTDFNIGQKATRNSTLHISSPSYVNVGTNVVTDATSTYY